MLVFSLLWRVIHFKTDFEIKIKVKPFSCWTWIYPTFANSVDPDQLASSEANWSESALFDIMWIYSSKPDQVIWLAES